MIKDISIGIVILAISLGLAHSTVGFPFERPIIYYSLKTTQGSMISTLEEIMNEGQGTKWFSAYTFTYVANGKKFTRTIHFEGRLKPKFVDISDPIPTIVVYSSVFPSFAQVDDDGVITFWDYVVKGTLATLLAYGISIWIIIAYFKNMNKETQTKPSMTTE
jgi:hypothetical protein